MAQTGHRYPRIIPYNAVYGAAVLQVQGLLNQGFTRSGVLSVNGTPSFVYDDTDDSSTISAGTTFAWLENLTGLSTIALQDGQEEGQEYSIGAFDISGDGYEVTGNIGSAGSQTAHFSAAGQRLDLMWVRGDDGTMANAYWRVLRNIGNVEIFPLPASANAPVLGTVENDSNTYLGTPAPIALSITTPTAGHLLVGILAVNAGSGARAIVDPDGFTPISSQLLAGTNHYLNILIKTAAGSETDWTPTVEGAVNAVIAVLQISGHDPLDAVAAFDLGTPRHQTATTVTQKVPAIRTSPSRPALLIPILSYPWSTTPITVSAYPGRQWTDGFNKNGPSTSNSIGLATASMSAFRDTLTFNPTFTLSAVAKGYGRMLAIYGPPED